MSSLKDFLSISFRLRCPQPWQASSWPDSRIESAIPGSTRRRSPRTKKVARAPRSSRNRTSASTRNGERLRFSSKAPGADTAVTAAVWNHSSTSKLNPMRPFRSLRRPLPG